MLDSLQFSYLPFSDQVSMTISLAHAILSLFLTFLPAKEFSIHHMVALAPIRSPNWILFSLDTNLKSGYHCAYPEIPWIEEKAISWEPYPGSSILIKLLGW